MTDVKVVGGRNYKDEYDKLRRIHESTLIGTKLQEAQMHDLQKKLADSVSLNTMLTNQLNSQKELNQIISDENNKRQRVNGDEVKRLRALVKSLGGNPD